MLFDLFTEALQHARGTAWDGYLIHLSGAVKKIETAATGDTTLQEYVNELSKFAEHSTFGTDPHLTNKFAQTVGEAHFYALAIERGISLRRIPEMNNVKTPDFEATNHSGKLHFEVKTLSVVGGDRGIEASLISSLEANLDLERQVRAGKSIATAVSDAQPYGNRREAGFLPHVIDTLLEKIRSNIKRDQFSRPNTYLVVNLSMIPPTMNDPKVLRPAYVDDYLFPKAITGELWTVGFGRPGQLVLGQPEMEGKPGVCGRFDKIGVLEDPDFAEIKGMLFMVHPLRDAPKLLGLFRSGWADDISMGTSLAKLVDNNWNDALDSNGFALK